MERKITFKTGARAIMLSTALIFGLSGCAKRNDDNLSKFETSSEETTSMVELKNYNDDVIETNETEEETTEVSKEEFLTIEKMDNYYNSYSEFFESHGIDEQEFYDMNYVLNNKLIDENGNVILSVEDIWNAYSNISNLITVPELVQKIDNINAKNYGIEINDDIVIPKVPKLSELIDPDTKDATYTISKLQEYEDFRDELIKDLNEKGTYNKDSIRDYAIKLNVTDINSGNGYSSRVSSNNALYVLADVNVNVLQLAAMAYNEQEFLDVNVDGVKKLKINPTNGESDIENAVNQLLEQGWINEATLADVLSYYTYQVAVNNEINGIEISERLGVSIDQANLLLAYIEYRSKMAITSHIQTECNAEARTVSEVQEIENSINNKYKKTLNLN